MMQSASIQIYLTPRLWLTLKASLYVCGISFIGIPRTICSKFACVVVKFRAPAPQQWLNAVYGCERKSVDASLVINRRGLSEDSRSMTRVGRVLVPAFDRIPSRPQSACDS